jgi:hypothetical protein
MKLIEINFMLFRCSARSKEETEEENSFKKKQKTRPPSVVPF